MESDGATGLPDPCCGSSGAIFMANHSTMKECLRWKIFGLPSSFGGFIKEIKAGMILFLFEYEDKKLYGVFEAACNGALNIIPHAFGSSGKSFPAQVRFRQLWHCHPLTESEFCFAIKDNYFTTKKFSFILSEEQVSNLLLLFDSKKKRIKSSESCTHTITRVDEPIASGVALMVNQKFLSPKKEYHDKIDLESIKHQGFSHPGMYKSVGQNEPPLDRAVSSFGGRSISCATYFEQGTQDRDIVPSQSTSNYTLFRNCLNNPLQDSYSSYRIPGSHRQQSSGVLIASMSSAQAFTGAPLGDVVGRAQGSQDRDIIPSQSQRYHSFFRNCIDNPSHDSYSSCSIPESQHEQSFIDRLHVPLSSGQTFIAGSFDKVVGRDPQNHLHQSHQDPKPTSQWLSSSTNDIFRGRPGLNSKKVIIGKSNFDPYAPHASVDLVKSENFGQLKTDTSISVDHSGQLFQSFPRALPSDNNCVGKRCWEPIFKDSPRLTVADFDMNANLNSSNVSLVDEYNCSQEFNDCFVNELTNYSGSDSACLPNYVKPSSKSDKCHQRTSVFSRLSRARNMKKNCGAFVKDVPILSVNQILSRLAKHKKKWRKDEVSNHKIRVGGLKPIVNVEIKNEASKQQTTDGGKHVNLKVDLSQVSVSRNEGLPFDDFEKGEDGRQVLVNFKRRSTIEKIGESQETRGGECTLEKQKRRKLIRPSFCNDSLDRNVTSMVKQSIGDDPSCTSVKYTDAKDGKAIIINQSQGNASSNCGKDIDAKDAESVSISCDKGDAGGNYDKDTRSTSTNHDQADASSNCDMV